MSNTISFLALKDFLIQEGLMIVSKEQFLNKLIEVNVKSSVDKRVLWIDKKTARLKYGVTNHWLDQAEKDASSYLQVSKGKGRTSTKKYKESSIIDEQQRQAEC